MLQSVKFIQPVVPTITFNFSSEQYVFSCTFSLYQSDIYFKDLFLGNMWTHNWGLFLSASVWADTNAKKPGPILLLSIIGCTVDGCRIFIWHDNYQCDRRFYSHCTNLIKVIQVASWNVHRLWPTCKMDSAVSVPLQISCVRIISDLFQSCIHCAEI